MARYKRKIVLNKKFQIKYAVMIGLSMLVLLIIAGFFTYTTINPLFPNILSSHYASRLKSIQTKLIFSGLAYIVLISVLSVYVSHKIAGPIWKIETDIKSLVEKEDFDMRFSIRRKDELHELVKLLNLLMDKFSEKLKK